MTKDLKVKDPITMQLTRTVGYCYDTQQFKIITTITTDIICQNMSEFQDFHIISGVSMLITLTYMIPSKKFYHHVLDAPV